MLPLYLLLVPWGSAPSLQAWAGYIPSRHSMMMANSGPAFWCLNPELSPPLLSPCHLLAASSHWGFSPATSHVHSEAGGEIWQAQTEGSRGPAFPDLSLACCVAGTVRARHRQHLAGRAAQLALLPLSHEGPWKKPWTAALHHCCPTVMNRPPTPSLAAGLLVPGHGGPMGAPVLFLYWKSPGMEASRKV